MCSTCLSSLLTNTAQPLENSEITSKPGLIQRYEKVITVLAKYGFADLAAHPPFSRFIPKWDKLFAKYDGKPVVEYTRYERIRMVCEELGTTFIKFAQIASNRPDILPEELIEELKQFQDQAIPLAEPEIRGVIEKELGNQPEAIFERFDFQPLASGSIAQVHRVKLKSGEEAVIKVQRPGIEDTIELDITILKTIARLVARHFPQFASFQPMELVKMFEKSIRKELNFGTEAASSKRFAEQFKGNDDIHVPILYPAYSTSRVLCMEYIDGIKCTDLDALKAIGMTGRELAEKGINLYFEQVLDHGFFHADPHPGNIFVLRNKKVCFIDFGMMGTVSESDRLLLGDLLLAVHERDVMGLKKSLMRFAWEDVTINELALEHDITAFFSDYENIGIGDIDSAEVMALLNALFFDYKIKVPSNLLLLLKALVVIEGVGLLLDPKYDIINSIAPFARRLLLKKYTPERLSKRALRSLGSFAAMATTLPADIDEIIEKIKKGKLHVEFAHKGLESLQNTLETASKRITYAVIVGSIILGSSLLVIADVPPHIYGIPAIGVGGFLIAGILGLRLLMSMLRQGKF